MANLKLDLVNKINNEKYYDEIELIRLAQDPNTNYKNKIEDMGALLKKIAIHNAQLGLVEQYFKEPEQQNAPVTNPPQAAPTQTQPGQSHAE